ncbi:hypothetical protein ACKFKG_09480 [Phormidesmis sp. 146-35]
MAASNPNQLTFGDKFNAFKAWKNGLSLCLLLSLTLLETTPAARADSAACNRPFADIPREVLYKGNGRDHNYPARLHGKTVRLINGARFHQSYALVERPSKGDIVSIDRTTDPDKLNTKQKWWDGSKIRNWEFCQSKVTINNAPRWTSPTIYNLHVPVRVCLRHNGALQCANTWYADLS